VSQFERNATNASKKVLVTYDGNDAATLDRTKAAVHTLKR
jgi:hypothetical protein